METKTEIAKAIIAVMKAVKGIDKSMTIGTGNSAYKGVPDQEVKKIIGEAMAENGLCILPIGVDASTKIERWEETTTYNNVPSTKMKQSVFTEAKTRYLLLHQSGESIELEGYGQGVDSQDKSAGKATTYALKYTLLYTFLIPTGKIDDSDNTHSDNIQTPSKPTESAKQNDTDKRPWIVEKQVNQAVERMKNGEVGVYEKIDAAFKMKKEFREKLQQAKKSA